MHRWIVLFGILWCLPRVAVGETTPIAMTLHDDQVTRIEVEYSLTEKDIIRLSGPLTPEVKKVWASALGQVGKAMTWHYDLYVPPGYGKEKDRRYPCLFIASPSGNARLGAMEERIRKEEWIAVMLVESKNSSSNWLPNFCAAHDDVVKRMRVLEDWKFGTGMSGGARCCSSYPMLRDGFRGVILQAAGLFGGGSLDFYNYLADEAKKGRQYLVYGTFGKTDMNLYEAVRIRSTMRGHVVRNVEIFEGGHDCAPALVIDHAFDWIERMAIFVLPPRNADRELARHLISRKTEVASKTEGLVKYEMLEAMTALVNRNKLTEGKDGDKTLIKKVAIWQDEMKTLAKNEVVKNELMSRDEYRKIEAKESPTFETLYPGAQLVKQTGKNEQPASRRPSGNAKSLHDKWELDRKALVGFADEYRKFAKKYKGSIYAARAEARAKSLDMETTAQNK
ncbi:MAG: hypothetical protein V1899_01325 [Planctomycetota bacterium]